MTKAEHRRAIRGYDTATLRSIASDLARSACNPTEPLGWWLQGRYAAIEAELQARGSRRHAKPVHRFPKRRTRRAA